MTKFHLFSQDSVRLETAPTGGVRKLKILTTDIHRSENFGKSAVSKDYNPFLTY